MKKALLRLLGLLAGLLSVAPQTGALAQAPPSYEIEFEAGPVWQSRNDVQIPNDQTGTRFSLADLAGKGPWPAGRAYLTWNINQRHGLRLLLAPFSLTETGSVSEPVSFAGETFQPGTPISATYKFSSWRISYRYRFTRRENLDLWVGFTAKLRDAKIELDQGERSSKDTDLGFVPLLHLAADWRLTPAGHLLFDFDGLAGGPGRAFDSSLKFGYDLGDRWRVTAGYRTLEGGADVESVYNFAWLHYGVFSIAHRL
ncbi:MAG: hypothetical protein PVJ04_05740 [Gemmatimonadota bacterium]|jgi:hypothetical protein